MFALVIPIRRTPFGLDGFDYTFPDNEPYHVGQLVYVPLRGHKTEAVIRRISPTSVFAAQAKAILGPVPGGCVLPTGCLELLSWVAERTFSSLPTVLHAWLGTIPKRIPKEECEPEKNNLLKTTVMPHAGHASAHWQTDHTAVLLRRAREALAQKKRVLILTPWTNRVSEFLETLQTMTTDAQPLHGDLTDGAYFSHWSNFLTGTCSCLVATRLGAWLAPAADLVLIDEPENDDHKQDEQAPRYDARRLASWAAKYAGVEVEASGLTPPLHAGANAPDIACELQVHTFHPKGRSAIPNLQADTLLALREHEGPRIILHPIRGRAARLTCRDCGWQAPCEHCGAPISANQDCAICRQCGKVQPLPLICSACGGVDLSKATPGIEVLQRMWERTEPDTPVQWRDTTNESLEQPIPSQTLFVITIAHLVGGGIEDLRRTERRMIAIRRLMNRLEQAQGKLLIQSLEQDLPLWEAWKTELGVQAAYTSELETRRLFHYPPTWRRVKCLIDGNKTHIKGWIQEAEKLIQGQGTLEGPFPIQFRRAGSSPRSVVHLLFNPEVSEAALVGLLQPLAKHALIDLDPIAFFK